MTRKGILLFAALCIIWGIPYFLIRIAVAEIPPAVLVFARTAIGGLVLLPIVIARRGFRGIGTRWTPLLIYAAVEVAVPWFFLSSAEVRLSSSLAGLLVAAVPLIGVVISPLFGNRERIGLIGIGGLAVGLIGVAAVVGFDFRASQGWALVEMALVVGGYAVGPAIVRRYLSGIASVDLAGISLAACAVLYAPAALLQMPHTLPSAEVLVSVGVLALLCTALAFLVFFELIAEIGPVRSTVVTYINPAIAALMGVALLHENITIGMGIGFLLVLAGSALATRRRESRTTTPAGEQ